MVRAAAWRGRTNYVTRWKSGMICSGDWSCLCTAPGIQKRSCDAIFDTHVTAVQNMNLGNTIAALRSLCSLFIFLYFFLLLSVAASDDIYSNLATILPAPIVEALFKVRTWIGDEMNRQKEAKLFAIGQSGMLAFSLVYHCFRG